MENKKFMVEIKNSKQHNPRPGGKESESGMVSMEDDIDQIMDKMTKSQMHAIMASIENQNLFIINLINDMLDGKKKQIVAFEERCDDSQAKIDKISSLVDLKTSELTEKRQKAQVLENSYKGIQDAGGDKIG